MTTRITSLDDPVFQALFDDLDRSWFRLETLQAYDVGYESDEFQAFRRTGRLDREPGAWQRMIARHYAAGRALQRVHVVEEPLTDYLRYEFAAYEVNAAAGEEIGLIPVSQGSWPESLPRGIDFWLFDDEDLWSMEYDDASRFVAAERVVDPERRQQARTWRDVALAAAVPLGVYLPRAA